MKALKNFSPFIYCAVFFTLFEILFWQGGRVLLNDIHLKMYGKCLDYACDTTRILAGQDFIVSIAFIVVAVLCFALFARFLVAGLKKIMEEKNDFK